jgi:hypothetical protein
MIWALLSYVSDLETIMPFYGEDVALSLRERSVEDTDSGERRGGGIGRLIN